MKCIHHLLLIGFNYKQCSWHHISLCTGSILSLSLTHYTSSIVHIYYATVQSITLLHLHLLSKWNVKIMCGLVEHTGSQHTNPTWNIIMVLKTLIPCGIFHCVFLISLKVHILTVTLAIFPIYSYWQAHHFWFHLTIHEINFCLN